MNNSKKINFPNKAQLLKAIANCNNANTDAASAMYVIRCRLEAYIRLQISTAKVAELKASITELANNKTKYWQFEDKLSAQLEALVQESANMGILGNTRNSIDKELVKLTENLCGHLLSNQVEYAFANLSEFTEFAKEFAIYAKENFAKVSPEFLEED